MKTLKLPAAIIGLTALLTACPSTTDNSGVTPPPNPQPPVVAGPALQATLPNWSLGKTDAAVIARTASGRYKTLTAGSVSASGALTLPLPDPVNPEFLYGLRPSNCAAQLTTSRNDIGALDVQDLSVSQGDRLLGTVDVRADSTAPLQVGSSFLSKFYVSNDVTISGTLTCPALKETYVDLNLKKGWNTLLRTVNEIKGGEVTAVTFTQAPATAAPILDFQAYRDGVLALTAESVDVQMGVGKSMPVSLLPVGTYSGPVSVRLEGIPGVSVSSGPINIPAFVRAQGVGPLSIDSVLTFQATGDAATGQRKGTLVFTTGNTEDRVPLTVNVSTPFHLSLNGYLPSVQLGSVSNLGAMLTFNMTPPAATLPVTLLDAPAGIRLAPLALTSTAGGASSLTGETQLTVDRSVKPGMYTVRLGATFNGVVVPSSPFSLTVLEPSLQVGLTGGGQARPGSRVSYLAYAKPQNGYRGTVDVRVSTHTGAVPYTLQRSEGTINLTSDDQGGLEFSLLIDADAKPGTYPGFRVDFTFDGKTVTEQYPFVMIN